VTYLVKVPRRLAVQIDDKVGSTTLTGLAGPLALTSSSGNIDATGLTSATVTAVPMPARSPWDLPRRRPPWTHKPRSARLRYGYLWARLMQLTPAAKSV
jgi:hypothetical protein